MSVSRLTALKERLRPRRFEILELPILAEMENQKYGHPKSQILGGAPPEGGFMNNGKVRIYELSRELNLDNKDILAVCDQLNIAVKSHSSTITEDEAERIRGYSEKYVASHPEARSSAAVKHKDSSGRISPPSSPEAVGNSGGPKKPQVLAIHQKPSRSNSPKPAVDQSEASAPAQVQSLPQAPVSQHGSKPMKPTILNRPLRPNEANTGASGSEAGIAEGETEQEAPAGEVLPPANSEPTVAVGSPRQGGQGEGGSKGTNAPERPSEQEGRVKAHVGAGSPRQAAPKAEQPKLSSPPVRQSASEPNSPQAAKQERPILKGPRTEKAQGQEKPKEQVGAAGSPRQAGAGPITAKGKASAPQSTGAPPARTGKNNRPKAEGGTLVGPKHQPVPELLTPPTLRTKGDRPVGRGRGAGVDGLDPETGLDLGTDGAEGEELLVERPVPPRPPKRVTKKLGGKSEEDDMQDFPEKAAKAAGKAKRRVKPQAEEEDDDLESDLDELPANTLVSLSIARPAKPKAAPSQRTAAAAAPIAFGKMKKSGSSREAAARNRARRQELKSVKKERPEKLILTGSMTVRELADALAVPETDIVKTLFFKGMAVNITQTLDIPTSTLVAQELGVEVETGEVESEARKVTEMVDAEDLVYLQRRPPVVTIMGHVDHGKTTLLDAIRQTKVAQGEAGGITQHIGAYHVDVEHNAQMQQVVFLDTPGHEAFTAMRARGARVTDIAVLVVAADDGVQPQTIEAISHAKAAEVPIVVAINKIDKEDAQPERVKQELTEYGLVSEEWGGDTIMVPVSAIKRENLDTLLEMILLVAEIEELSANPDRTAKGTVIEAHLDKAKGPVATLLVQNGTLRVGDVFVAGSAFGKVRAMVDDRGHRVDAASPSFAVEVLGLGDVPAAGDEFEVFLNEKEARAIADTRSEQNRQSRLQQAMASRRVTLSGLSQQAKEGQLKELNLILKADVQGSLEAILGSLKQLPQNEVQVRVLFSAPGEITETDVDLAAASDAVIIGFNTTLATGARQAADQAGVDVREYNIIYKLLDDITAAMEGLLDPELVEEALGQAEVRAVFPASKGSVAGCYVQNGKVIRNCKVRVRRSGNVVHEGVLDSLKRMKEDAKEVNAGFECGIGLNNFHAWVENDIIEAFRMVTKRRTLSPN